MCIICLFFSSFSFKNFISTIYIIFELLLFCSEASLVGGIADWFAVTALFKKPLGFPFHTAILPSRRDAFINSCVRMLQTEFLSKRKIYRRICNADLLSWGLNWAKNPDNKKYILNEVMQFLVKKIAEIDTAKVAQKNSEKIAQLILKEYLAKIPAIAITYVPDLILSKANIWGQTSRI